MGLFGNMFEKKNCAFCGKEIGLLGNRKLKDGNMCKECASKLSPWFSDRKESTIEEIEKQLKYRELNQKNLESFQPTRSISVGSYTYFIDEPGERFVVTTSDNFRSKNPDIISFSQVLSMDLDIRESKHEIKQEVDGKLVSYDPEQYEYTYYFTLKAVVNHPYFDDFQTSVTVGDEAKDLGDENYMMKLKAGKDVMHAIRPDLYDEFAMPIAEEEASVEIPAAEPECVNAAPVFRWFCPNCGKENFGKFCVGCGTEIPANAFPQV